jgi:hypothetical protein
LLSFTGMTKVLVATGQDRDSRVMEIIDLTDLSNVCQPSVPDNYPIDTVSGASGGLLKNSVALFCGGEKYESPSKV